MTFKQRNLFPEPGWIARPRDPNVAAAAVPRLSRQCSLILERLKAGPATNAQLAAIALKYTGRISDLRKAGCVFDHQHDPMTGLVVYTLVSYPEGLQ